MQARLRDLPQDGGAALAAGLISTLIGGMAVARALPTRDASLQHLDATRDAALRLIDGAWLHCEPSS